MSRRLKNNDRTIDSKTIYTRKELFEVATNMLDNNLDHYRHIVVGPFCFCPTSYMEKRALSISTINYEEKLMQYLLNNCTTRNSNIRIIFRNTDRFEEKINRFVKEKDRKKFIKDTIRNIHILFGEKYDKGPDIRCIDTGFMKISMIYDKGMIQTTRKAEKAELNTAELITSSSQIKKEVDIFDNIFDYGSPNQEKEIKKLIKFVKNLWKNNG